MKQKQTKTGKRTINNINGVEVIYDVDKNEFSYKTEKFEEFQNDLWLLLGTLHDEFLNEMTEEQIMKIYSILKGVKSTVLLFEKSIDEFIDKIQVVETNIRVIVNAYREWRDETGGFSGKN